MRVPIEVQQHAMLFVILKPRWQDDRSCRQNSFVSCVELKYCYGRKFYSFIIFFAFSFHLTFGFFRLILAEFFFWSLIIDGRLPFLLGV